MFEQLSILELEEKEVVEEVETKDVETESEELTPVERQEAKQFCNVADRIYYPINEQMARIAHEVNSMREYKPNSLTEEYKATVDHCYDLAEKCSAKREKATEKAWYLAHKYAYKMAQWYNDQSRNEASCPSILVCGAGNFPVKKKERQNSRRDTLRRQWNELNAKYPQRIIALMNGAEIIKSGDADAVDALKDKIQKLKDEQELMKKVNAYYRKHKTLDGCDLLDASVINKLKVAMGRSWRGENAVPFESYNLQNNNQNIHRLEGRLKSLESAKETGTTEEENDLFKIVRNTDIMRLQLLFDGKPDADTIKILKSHGFKWAPSQSAWQRNLNLNGEYALKGIKRELKISEVK